MPKKKTPNPGSAAAVGEGCRCPVIDNYYGKGMPGYKVPKFYVVDNCPLHGVNKRNNKGE